MPENYIRNLICILLVVAAAFLTGCGREPNQSLLRTSDRFTVVERLDKNDTVTPALYIVVDNESGYEYFTSAMHEGYVIGAPVLDKDGHPKKYNK